MSYIEGAKLYTGETLDTIFFRPMLTGPSAQDLGVRILYNLPSPTTIPIWEPQTTILQQFKTCNWNGTMPARKRQKTIKLSRVKAEMGMDAIDYFSLIYERITASSEVNYQDFTGTMLEKAETELFRKAIAESIRATMWYGDSKLTTGLNTFNGFLTAINEYVQNDDIYVKEYLAADMQTPEKSIEIFESLWLNADPRLQAAKYEGHLAYFVTSDIYHLYEKFLDERGAEGSYTQMIEGRPTLLYHGIPVIDVALGGYAHQTSFDTSFCIFTDRRNLVLAVNTSDFPGTEVRMWYNPDVMENRQRAVFLAGCDVLDERMIAYAHMVETLTPAEE